MFYTAVYQHRSAVLGEQRTNRCWSLDTEVQLHRRLMVQLDNDKSDNGTDTLEAVVRVDAQSCPHTLLPLCDAIKTMATCLAIAMETRRV